MSVHGDDAETFHLNGYDIEIKHPNAWVLFPLGLMALCVGMIIGWVRSYQIGGSVMWTDLQTTPGFFDPPGKGYVAGLGHGSVVLMHLSIATEDLYKKRGLGISTGQCSR